MVQQLETGCQLFAIVGMWEIDELFNVMLWQQIDVLNYNMLRIFSV